MSIQQFQNHLTSLYNDLPIATALFQRNEDGIWIKLWQNPSAHAVWGDFDISEYPLFKLELMDALSQVAPSVFSFSIPNTIEEYRFIATPHDEALIVQFVVDNEKLKVDEPNQAAEKDIYPTVIKAADLGVYDWDIETDFIQFNQRAYDVFGVNSTLLGSCYQQLMDRIHEKDAQQVVNAIEGHLESNWPLDTEFRVLNSKGHYQWVQMTGQAQWEAEKPTRLVGTLVDITSRKFTELQLKQRELMIEKMIDALPISIYVKDAQGCYRFFNKEAEKEVGKVRGQLLGRTDYEVYPMPQGMRHAEADKLIQQSEELAIFESAAEEGDSTRWLLQGKVPMKVIQADKPYEMWLLSFALDITERKVMEEELKEARVIAEDAAKAKADFLSVMSHEIRTPLNSVIGNAGLLLAEHLEDNQSRHIEMIKRSGEHLLYLINDILDFNKLEAGKVELEKKAFNLEQQIKTVVEMSATNAKLKHIELNYGFQKGLSNEYIGDEGRIRQILLNLVGNAIKFTSKGGVKVQVKPLELNGRVRFEVTDTGIGISEENIPKLFSEFSQADASTTRKFGGTGLGLSISKKLVEAMNGQIGIISKEGEGSTFWFELPIKAIEPEEESLNNRTEGEQEITDLSILVAEDNLPNQFLIKTILSKLGHRVEIANNGLEAYEMIKAQDIKIDLVLMDMQMPEMDGLEATQQIRMLESDVANTPIVALTANTHEEDFEAVMAAGMNDYLSKPVNIAALKSALQKWGKNR